MPSRIYQWLDSRLNLKPVERTLLDEPIPGGASWIYVFGSATLFLFVTQAVTGMFLAIYYAPTPDHAHDSVRFIMEEVLFGSFVRGLHHWGASAMVIMIARMTPGLSFLIPLFLLFQWLNLLGTLMPQIIIHLVVTVPIVVWIMIGYFETTPMELEEAASIDGATSWQVFRLVALPIARPGIVVAFILSVIFSWNNFVFGIVLASRETRTLPVAVYNMLSYEQVSWGPLAAAALVVTLPVLVLTLFAQRQIVAGLTAGAVKGG